MQGEWEKWPPFTVGSRWNSVGRGVGVVEKICNDDMTYIRFADDAWYYNTHKDRAVGVDWDKGFDLTGPADPQTPGMPDGKREVRSDASMEQQADEQRAWKIYAGRRFKADYDGFIGTAIGGYRTIEGRDGLVLQMDGTKVVHVYGINRLTELRINTTKGQ